MSWGCSNCEKMNDMFIELQKEKHSLKKALEKIRDTKDHEFGHSFGSKELTVLKYNTNYLRSIAREALNGN